MTWKAKLGLAEDSITTDLTSPGLIRMTIIKQENVKGQPMFIGEITSSYLGLL